MSNLPFGRYKHADITDADSGYLKWLVIQSWFEEKYPELLKEAEEELAYRDTWDKHWYEERGKP